MALSHYCWRHYHHHILLFTCILEDEIVLCLASFSSLALDPLDNDIHIPISLRKGKHLCTYPISSFVSYDLLSLSSYSFIASLDCTFSKNSLRTLFPS